MTITLRLTQQILESSGREIEECESVAANVIRVITPDLESISCERGIELIRCYWGIIVNHETLLAVGRRAGFSRLGGSVSWYACKIKGRSVGGHYEGDVVVELGIMKIEMHL